MIVLGIESTCDETAASVVKDGKEILSNVIASSAELHARYGGVFPEMACRQHIEAILPVVEEALMSAQVSKEEVDLIAVARGPGLIGALLIGLNAAKGLSMAWKKPLIGVNHVEAHLYAAMMGEGFSEEHLPALGVVLSGGHTLLVRVLGVGSYEPIGTTVDDACGEAFDKVASLLGLPYPGGPHVERLALKGNPKAVALSAGRVKKNPFDFSFSGLKTNVLYAVKGQNGSGKAPLSDQERADLAASFQETAFADVVEKTVLASQKFPCRSILFGGGVSNNRRLRTLFGEAFSELPLFWPPASLSLDNAAMIAGLGYQKFLQNGPDPLDLEALPRIRFA